MSTVLRNTTTASVMRAACLAAGLSVSTVAGAQTMATRPSAPPAAVVSGHASADSAQALLNFVTTVNRDAIVAARLAMTRATNPALRAYASKIVDDHTKAMDEWAKKAPFVSLTVPDSAKASGKGSPTDQAAAMANGIAEVRDTTTALRGGMGAAAVHSANASALIDLQKATGSDFDAQYLAAELRGHAAVLKELEAHPTTYTDLQTLYAQFKMMVESHQLAAKKIRGG